MSSQGLLSRAVLAATVVFGLGACRSRAGEPCRCASDCGAGYDCYAEGEKTLIGDACFKPGVIGSCVVSESIDTGGLGTSLDPIPVRDDLPSKRDLGGGLSDTASGSATATTDEPTGTSTTDTSTTDTTTTSSSTTDDTTTTSTSTTESTGTTTLDTTDSTTTLDSSSTSTTTDTSTSTGSSSSGTDSSSSSSSSGSSG